MTDSPVNRIVALKVNPSQFYLCQVEEKKTVDLTRAYQDWFEAEGEALARGNGWRVYVGQAVLKQVWAAFVWPVSTD